MKKYNIILQEGWMGDTLWACNIIKNLSDMGYEIIMFHKWKFMRKLIDLFEINQNPSNIDLDNYKKIIYSHRTNHYENPLIDYLYTLNIEGVDIERASKFYSINSQETVPTGLFFKDNGSVMYLLGVNSDSIYQYDLTTPWDILSVSYASKNYSVAIEENQPRGLFFKNDGSNAYIVGDNNKKIYQYSWMNSWQMYHLSCYNSTQTLWLDMNHFLSYNDA